MSANPSPADPSSGNARAPAPEGGARRRLAASGTLLTTLTALPAAVLVVPDAVFNVVPAAASALQLGDAEIAVLLRATGYSLPTVMLAVPLAAVAVRRFSAWAVLLTGLAALLAGLAGARFVDSVPLIALVRAAQGAGAGIILPASLVLVWERASRCLAAVWAGVLAAALILAMPLALSAVPVPPDGTAVPDWRAALAPVPWSAGAAVAAAFAYPLLRGRRARALPAARHAERSQLLLPLGPAAGFAVLAIVAAFDWSPGARLIVAGAALLALLGLALAAGRDGAAGSPFGCAFVMITAGLLCHPVAGPLAGLASVAAHAREEPPGVPLLPFAVAAAAALAAALASTRCGPRLAVPAGHCLVIAGVLLGLAAAPGDPWTLLVPLGAGAGLALAAALRDAGAGAALFGLSLCFPALLAGQLFVLSLQAARLERLRPVTEAEQAGALLDAYQVWLVAAAAAAAALAAVTACATARRAGTGAAETGVASPAGRESAGRESAGRESAGKAAAGPQAG